MRNNKGVTLASLTVYVIVLVIVLVALTFVSANFTSQIADVTTKGRISNESTKVYSFLVTDVKSADSVVEYADNYLRLDNDVKYSIEYKFINEKENQRRQYEIYRNGVLISENILDANFDYDNQNNTVIINIKYFYGDTIITKSQAFKVGRGY